MPQRSLFLQILAGLLLGIGCGLFFGESCAWLSVVGDLFVGLLRVTVLPYIAVALIANFGRLSLSDGYRLTWVGGTVLLVLWAVALSAVWLLPLGFPEWSSGSFFSSSLLAPVSDIDLWGQFVPENIFAALANNQVPAIVIFCIASGLALGRVPNRSVLIDQLDVLSETLIRLSVFIARLTPIGVFAISASIAGTVSLESVIRLQAYLVAYAAGVLFLGGVVLPLMVSAVTPLKYSQVISVAKEPMLTALATGKLIIVLPLLIQNTELLFRELDRQRGVDLNGGDWKGGEGSEAGNATVVPAPEVLYATAYSFPHAGKLLSILFVPFAGWFLGTPITESEYPGMLASGLFAYFGGPIVAMPFLLDEMHLPHDMFQLFLLSGVFCERLGDALGAMHLVVFTLITQSVFRRTFRIRLPKIARLLITSLVVGAFLIGGVRLALYSFVGSVESKVEIVQQMQLIESPVESKLVLVPGPNPVPLQPGETLLHRIRRRQILRVGYNEDKVPFAFFNASGELVGYDVNMAHALARDLGVTLEFVAFDRRDLADQLADDYFDVVMSGLIGTLERSELMQHTDSYMDVHLSLVVPDYKVREYKTLQSIRSHSPLRIGFVDLSRGFLDRLQAELPAAELVRIGSNRDFFTDHVDDVDALLISAESGSALSLMYPGYEVVVPQDLNVKLPLFYALERQDPEFRNFLEHWISLRQKDGTTDEFYDHWILGRTTTSTERRWSVIRDVLKWGD